LVAVVSAATKALVVGREASRAKAVVSAAVRGASGEDKAVLAVAKVVLAVVRAALVVVKAVLVVVRAALVAAKVVLAVGKVVVLAVGKVVVLAAKRDLAEMAEQVSDPR
jgi:hypothetical protein